MRIQLFGDFAVELDSGGTVRFPTDKVRALLAYLAVHVGQPIDRAYLVEMLWANYPERDGRRSLANALSRLKKSLRPVLAQLPNLLTITRTTAQLNHTDNVMIDVCIFRNMWGLCQSIDQSEWASQGRVTHALTTMVDLYRGDFLAGFSLSDCMMFDSWSVLQAETYRQDVLVALEKLTQHHLASSNLSVAEQYAQQQLHLEPWREVAHRQMIQIHLANGYHSAARRQWEQCQQLLWEELGVEPSMLTAALCAGWSDEATPAVDRPSLQPEPTKKRPHNLPAEITPFLGRADELKALQLLVSERVNRLVTLVGHGGAGKTRLSLALVRSQLPYFAHGVFFVSLVGVQSAENIPLAISSALKLNLTGEKAPLSQVCNYLRERELLLVLDNIEHLLQQSATIDVILQLFHNAPSVTLIVTSRSQLWVTFESVFPVGGLSYPSIDDVSTLDAPESFEALQLFNERCRRLRADFSLHDELDAVVQICQLVNGLPLGIELAAAQSSIASCRAVADALSASMSTLQTRMRDMPSRQRSLEAVFDYSWQLLSPTNQQILAQLSIFRSGFDAPTVAAIVPTATAQQLNILERHSLLQQDETGRYTLQEMVRQFAAGRLNSAEQSPLEKAYLHTYLNQVAALQSELEGGEPHVTAAKLMPDLNNIQHAWRLALSNHTFTVVQGATRALSNLLQLQSLHHLGYSLFQQAIDIAASETKSDAATRALPTLRVEAARFSIRLSQFEDALAWSRQARDLAFDLNESWACGNAINVMGEAMWRSGQHQASIDFLNSHSVLVTSTGSDRLVGSLEYNLGCAYQLIAKPDLATHHFHRALQLWITILHKRFEANTLNALGATYASQQQLDTAIQQYKKALAIQQLLQHKHQIALIQTNLADLEARRGRFALAKGYCQQAINYYQECGAVDELSRVLNNLGWSYHKLDEARLAEETLQSAMYYANMSGNRPNELRALSNLAEVKVHRGTIDDARALYQNAMRGWQAIGRLDFAKTIQKRLESL